MIKKIYVVAAVIRNQQGEVFIARRSNHVHQGGKLEFPGGKKEIGETSLDALKRELHEELGISVKQARPLIEIEHSYPEKKVFLDVWEVLSFDGEPYGAEGQEVFWLNAHKLNADDFPQANIPILTAIKLPRILMVSTDTQDQQSIIHSAKKYQNYLNPYELPYIYLRMSEHKQYVEEHIKNLKTELSGLCVLSREYHHNAYLHLTSDTLQGNTCEKAYSASVHNLNELKLAYDKGVEFVILGAINPTPTHPDGDTLGWQRAEQIIKKSKLPVYIIGGLKFDDLEKAIEIGAQGIAGISLFQNL